MEVRCTRIFAAFGIGGPFEPGGVRTPNQKHPKWRSQSLSGSIWAPVSIWATVGWGALSIVDIVEGKKDIVDDCWILLIRGNQGLHLYNRARYVHVIG